MTREIVTDWTTGSGRATTSVMHFDEFTATASAQRAALATFFDACAEVLDSGTRFVIRTDGKEFDDATGTLTGTWTDATSRESFGGVAGAAVADAAQVLVRWGTQVIRNGRFVRGRTFIPGYASSLQNEGQVGTNQVTDIAAAANQLITANVGLQVWSRPKAGSGGAALAAGTASVWNEFAVLRNRRS